MIRYYQQKEEGGKLPTFSFKPFGQNNASESPETSHSERQRYGRSSISLEESHDSVSSKETVLDKSATEGSTYELSECDDSYSSDSSVEEEQRGKKKIPRWAQKQCLIPAVERQFNGASLDPDDIFPEVSTCSLEDIFGRKKSRYTKRSSSANWDNDELTTTEKLVYKREMAETRNRGNDSILQDDSRDNYSRDSSSSPSQPAPLSYRNTEGSSVDEMTIETAGSSGNTIDSQQQNAFSMTPYSHGIRFNSHRMRIFAIQMEPSQVLFDLGKRGYDACLVYVKTKAIGPYELVSRRKDGGSIVVDVLLEHGYEATLLRASEAAFAGTPINIPIPGGLKTMSAKPLSLHDVVTNSDGVRLASGAFCVADSAFNVLSSEYSDLVLTPFNEIREDGVIINYADIGILLRARACDAYGQGTMETLRDAVCSSRDFPFRCTKIPKQYKKQFGASGPEARLAILIELSFEHMIVLQYHRHGDYGSTHFVGLSQGKVFDNDVDTGGKYDAQEFCRLYMAGVKKAAIIVPNPACKKRKKNFQ